MVGAEQPEPMHIETRYDREANLVVHVVTGSLDMAGIVEFAASRPEPFTWDMRILWDLRGLTGRRPVGSEMESFRDAMPAVWTGREQAGKTAVVATTDLDFGIARMAEAYSEDLPRNLRVFRDEAEALAWLTET